MAESNPKMGLRDDIIYTTVEYEVGCYPRIQYFQSELQEFLPRFERIYGQLPESMTRSVEDLALIINSMQNLIDSSPMLFMFGPTHSKIPKEEFVHRGKPKEVQTNAFQDLYHLHLHHITKKYRMALAMCTLRMMDTKQGKSALQKVASVFGVKDMIFYVDIEYEHNMDMVANSLTNLSNFLKMDVNNLKVFYESRKEIISDFINNHIEQRFTNTFLSLNKFLLQITKKRNRTHESRFGDKHTVRRFYGQVKRQFKNLKTVVDLLVTSHGESAAEKLAASIVAFTKTLLIRELAETYEIQDERVFDHCQKENFSDVWISSLRKHLCEVPFVRKLDQFVRDLEKYNKLFDAKSIGKFVDVEKPAVPLIDENAKPTDKLQRKHHGDVQLIRQVDEVVQKQNEGSEISASVTPDLKIYYTFTDVKIIAKLVGKALMKYLLQVGNNFKKIRVTLDLLIHLRKELHCLIGKTLDGAKYVERVPDLEHYRKQLQGIQEVNGMGLVLGKLFVAVEPSTSTERDIEVCKQVEKVFKGFPGEIVVEVVSKMAFVGKNGTGTTPKIDIGDAFVSESGARGTIGLFMNECDAENRDLHFVTCSHAVLGSNRVKTNDQNPVLLGTTRHTFIDDEGKIDVDFAAIRIEEAIKDRCNIFFKENNKTCKCCILNIDAIKDLKEGDHVYKRGSTTGETKGCIISDHFRGSGGLKDHQFVVGLPVGLDEASRNKGFAQEGDSGAVLYTKASDGEVQFIALLMGKFTMKEKEDNPNSTFKSLTNEIGSLILTACLMEGLNKIENKFNLKLTLPVEQTIKPSVLI